MVRVHVLPRLIIALAILGLSELAWAGPGGELKLTVVDRETKEPLACRMHLTNAKKQALKAPKVPFWHDHFVFQGEIILKLPKGEYGFVIERGPEYLTRTGHFSMDDFSKDTKEVDLKRFVNMADEGWWSGDLDVHRPANEIELLMLADDLHMAELVSWPDPGNTKSKIAPSRSTSKNPLVRFDGNRYYHLSAGRDARAGGSLLFFNLPRPLDLAGAKNELPPQMESILAAKQSTEAWVDAAKPYSWDLPLWIASGRLDSFELAPSDLGRSTAAKAETGGKPRDEEMYPGPTGGGRWTENIYYQLLNCGLRISPTAGSGSGEAVNPVGYNRLYVQVDGDFSYEKWWEGLREGRVVVTNGPLIRPDVEGFMPGHTFRGYPGEELSLEISLSMATRDPVSYLEVVKNGEVEQMVRLSDWANGGGKLPPIKFKESGWFLIRAVTELTETYRFATTAPYYVQFGQGPRISKSSAKFFLDWLHERTAKLKLEDPTQHEGVLKYHAQARDFWEDLVSRANAE